MLRRSYSTRLLNFSQVIFPPAIEFRYVRSKGVILFLKKQLMNTKEELIVEEGSHVFSSSDLHVPKGADRIT